MSEGNPVTTRTPAVRITAKRDGFRRAGKAHPDKPVIHPPGTFTADQIKALMAEPMLLVDVAGGDVEDWDLDEEEETKVPIEDPQPAPDAPAEEPPADTKAQAKGGKAGAKDPEPPKGGDGQ